MKIAMLWGFRFMQYAGLLMLGCCAVSLLSGCDPARIAEMQANIEANKEMIDGVLVASRGSGRERDLGFKKGTARPPL
jgi:hypothetical protein